MNVLLGLAFVLSRGGEAKRTEQCLSFPVLQLESDQMHLIQLTALALWRQSSHRLPLDDSPAGLGVQVIP